LSACPKQCMCDGARLRNALSNQPEIACRAGHGFLAISSAPQIRCVAGVTELGQDEGESWRQEVKMLGEQQEWAETVIRRQPNLREDADAAHARSSEKGQKLQAQAHAWTRKAHGHERKAKELEEKAGNKCTISRSRMIRAHAHASSLTLHACRCRKGQRWWCKRWWPKRGHKEAKSSSKSGSKRSSKGSNKESGEETRQREGCG
jgi:hypothetical protein